MFAFVVRSWFEGLSAPEQNLLVAVAVLLAGLVVGLIATFLVRRILLASGVDEAVEGTPFERTARKLGSSTVQLLAQLCGVFVFAVAALFAARTTGLVPEEALVQELGRFLPRLFVAVFVIVVGLLVADKVELFVDERLRSIKLPEVTIVSTLLKVSILYVAGLIALSQLGVATGALLILLAAYTFGLFFLSGLAFKDLLSSAAAGVYLLLTQPYAIGDEIEIDEKRGIVQEIDIFVTRIERDGEEYIVPNRTVLRKGATLIRD